MIKAMEVSGIEGNFRSSCEETMRVLRANKESVIAMLEAFVHDPLINWRLLNTAEVNSHPYQPIADRCLLCITFRDLSAHASGSRSHAT